MILGRFLVRLHRHSARIGAPSVACFFFISLRSAFRRGPFFGWLPVCVGWWVGGCVGGSVGGRFGGWLGGCLGGRWVDWLCVCLFLVFFVFFFLGFPGYWTFLPSFGGFPPFFLGFAQFWWFFHLTAPFRPVLMVFHLFPGPFCPVLVVFPPYWAFSPCFRVCVFFFLVFFFFVFFVVAEDFDFVLNYTLFSFSFLLFLFPFLLSFLSLRCCPPPLFSHGWACG